MSPNLNPIIPNNPQELNPPIVPVDYSSQPPQPPQQYQPINPIPSLPVVDPSRQPNQNSTNLSSALASINQGSPNPNSVPYFEPAVDNRPIVGRAPTEPEKPNSNIIIPARLGRKSNPLGTHNGFKQGIKKAMVAVVAVVIVGGGGFFLATNFIFNSNADYSNLVTYADEDGYEILRPEKWKEVDPVNEFIDISFADQITEGNLKETLAVMDVAFSRPQANELAWLMSANDDQKKEFLNLIAQNIQQELENSTSDIYESFKQEPIIHSGTDFPAVYLSAWGKNKANSPIRMKSAIIMNDRSGEIFAIYITALEDTWQNQDNEKAFNRILDEFKLKIQ